ncbi:MAG: CRISPR-associated endonuclease Cas1 [Verrucomicrobia bacterium]|nr:CRISPR-associated endonuclease Cas1 [Verrucomicrobiota bacterium]
MGNELSSELPEDWASVDMVAQHSYCPRRYHLMYVEGRWEDNAHTLAGKDVHRRVDRIPNLLPEAAEPKPEPAEPELVGDEPPVIARSVSLGCETLGLMGKLDLVSADPEGGEAVPVETKKSRVPNTPERSYPAERNQLMAQGLLLRAHGYTSTHGYIYYAGSRLRVRVDFTPELETETRAVIAAVRAGRAAAEMPEPLEDSPKCWGCSLNGICLPDETRELREEAADGGDFKSRISNLESDAPASPHGPDPRRLYPARDHATPLYVQEQGARVGKTSERLEIHKGEEKLGEAKVRDVSQLVLMGNVQVSAQTIHLLMEKEIPIVHLSTGGWFHGITHGMGIRNAYNRSAQYAAATDPSRCMTFAREVVRAKIANQRVLLMRNGSGPAADSSLPVLTRLLRECGTTDFSDLYQLLGHEGQAAGAYFAAFSTLLKTGELGDFHFTSRNRRPPRDPVNALLSYCYALLAKECAVALLGEGLDPWWGFYHQPRHGRPALALDLMEPFRPVIADSVVITAINTGMVKPRDFLTNSSGCALQPKGKKAILAAWEQRLDQLHTHPLFDYRCSWRTTLKIQARLLARWLRGDIPTFTCPVVR